jgi:hypothetical protein
VGLSAHDAERIESIRQNSRIFLMFRVIPSTFAQLWPSAHQLLREQFNHLGECRHLLLKNPLRFRILSALELIRRPLMCVEEVCEQVQWVRLHRPCGFDATLLGGLPAASILVSDSIQFVRIDVHREEWSHKFIREKAPFGIHCPERAIQIRELDKCVPTRAVLLDSENLAKVVESAKDLADEIQVRGEPWNADYVVWSGWCDFDGRRWF